MVLPWLPNVRFPHTCPNCGHVRSETGLWFRSVGSYKCRACSAEVKIPYEEKLRLLCRETKGTPDPPDSASIPSSDALAQQPPFRR
jgi:hypothetical protein